MRAALRLAGATIQRLGQWVVTPGLILGFSPAGHAQVEMAWTSYQSPLYPDSSGFARTLATADLNGDGFEDVIAMEPFADVAGLLDSGRGWVMFGPTFSTHLSFQASSPVQAERLGDVDLGSSGCSIGDVNGDGSLDLLVAAPHFFLGSSDVGRAHLFYGPNYSFERTFVDPTPEQGGRFSEGVLLVDANQDGLSDLFISAPEASGDAPGGGSWDAVGEVFYWDATKLAVPPVVVPQPLLFENSSFGSSLDCADIDEDGDPEILIGQEGYQQCCPFVGGAFHIVDGATLAAQTIIPTQVGAFFFGDVRYVGDVNGDGDNEIIVSAPQSFFAGCSTAGAVLILDGTDFASVTKIIQSPTACAGSVLFGLNVVVDDLDLDGAVDIMVGDTVVPVGSERVYVYFGPDFARVQTLGDDFGVIHLGFGSELATGDVDGDGFSELLVHASEGSASGTLFRYDVETLTVDTDLVSVAAGPVANLHIAASANEGGNVYIAALSISGASPGLIVGPGVYLPMNVDGVTFIGLSLVSSPYLVNFIGNLDATGQADLQLTLPPGVPAGLIGETLTIVAVTGTTSGQVSMATSSVDIVLDP